MNVIRLAIVWCIFLCPLFNAYAQDEAKWISPSWEAQDTVNIWTAYRKDFNIDKIPNDAVARIAVDSKYWLYINDQLVVFEGGLKRGPNPQDTYYDEVDLLPYLKEGVNTIAIKTWYFGKEGFSHKSSGNPGLFFDLKTSSFNLYSNKSWQAKVLREYQTAKDPKPNFRLPESNILYDARIATPDWYKASASVKGFQNALEIGRKGDAPWNKLIKRPIPLFKDFGLKELSKEAIETRGDTIICKLPYNMQFTPYVELMASAGKHIKFLTDNYLFYNGSAENIRAEYITKEGTQSYESLGWLNGHYLYIILPHDVKLSAIKFRESGYQTEFSGSFTSDDSFFNTLWEKARRTLYITMRDTYMDCPDRERAQWTGDAVLEAEEAFYALDTNSHALAKKWLYEIVNWQKADGTLFSPVPAGNWDKELPDQVLATVGYYGIWTYYLHTGDKQIIHDLYPRIQDYLKLWEKYPDGLVKLRAGGWQWGDWGDNKDMLLLYNLWYYLALEGNYLMASEINNVVDANKYKAEMENFRKAFNARFWKNKEYRDPDYTGKTDDRVHALAVLSGVATEDKYKDIAKVFAVEEHASPYMEKYVFEAMFKMNMPTEALARHKKRFSPMVNNAYFTTLFEGWGIGDDGFGGGTVNHAWSGGGLTILSSQVCGIRPLLPGYTEFLVSPQLGSINKASAVVTSVKGDIHVSIDKSEKDLNVLLTVPKNTKAKVVLPLQKVKDLTLNGTVVVENGIVNKGSQLSLDKHNRIFTLSEGNWTISAK